MTEKSMEASDRAEHLELILAFNRFSDKIDTLLKGGTHQTMTLSGGSFGVGISACACVVMLAVLAIVVPIGVGSYLAMQSDLKEVREELKTAQAFISAVYVAAPHLKPKDDKKEK